jgi:hypothetical protein
VLNIQDAMLNGLQSLKVTSGILYLYMVVLMVVGETIQGNILKENTIRGYLQAATMYIQSAGHQTDCPMTNPDMGNLFSSMEQCLSRLQILGSHVQGGQQPT